MMIAPPNRFQPPQRSARPQPYVRDAAGLWADVPAMTAFAHEIEQAIEGGALRYSQRQRLLRRADHHGIKRFDANLIIAMVQHRMGIHPTIDDAPGDNISRWTLLSVAAGIQGLILLAGWWVVWQ